MLKTLFAILAVVLQLIILSILINDRKNIKEDSSELISKSLMNEEKSNLMSSFEPIFDMSNQTKKEIENQKKGKKVKIKPLDKSLKEIEDIDNN